MNIDNTLALLTGHAPLTAEPEKLMALADNLIEAAKFDLGDWFTNAEGYKFDDDGFNVPNLLYDKMYFEVISIDGNWYGAFFENFGEYGVCGQMFVQAHAIHDQAFVKVRSKKASNRQSLFPVGLLFTQDGGKLLLHHNNNEMLKNKQIDSIVALNIILKAMATMNEAATDCWNPPSP